MSYLSQYEQEQIASMIYGHRFELHQTYPRIFNKPNISEVRDFVKSILPADPTYIPMECQKGNLGAHIKLQGNKLGVGWPAKRLAKTKA
jgi:hypothetical protein